ncbi:MAG: 5-(carboxyamino)imidazole ribonucleotide mutase [Candidatus Omnitrophica bacterium]|nr:5-(carboxyamino)imidazole ribonucleotide mutase [Candidatus Omnitrophota bacterium]MDD5654140.1 5-(carboxyamino)imidazole ribonucleotide mutase [Candidatus Omnitrophota bacterium]
MSGAKIAVIMGSQSDLETMCEGINFLKGSGVRTLVTVLSAHRTPKELDRYVQSAEQSGIKVIIAAAGGAAALAGAIAARTTLPVIGVPMNTKIINGLDSLLSTLQMPAGVPVATMTIGKAGAKNAAIFALEILGLTDKRIRSRLIAHKRQMRLKVTSVKIKI